MEFEKLKKIIADVLNVDPDEITMDTTFLDDLGADSLDVFQIIMGIEEEFDIEVPAEEAEKITTVLQPTKDQLIFRHILHRKKALLGLFSDAAMHMGEYHVTK